MMDSRQDAMHLNYFQIEEKEGTQNEESRFLFPDIYIIPFFHFV